MEIVSKSSIPSHAGNPTFVQHWMELRWTAMARCAEPIHGEVHLPYTVSPHIQHTSKTIHLVLRGRNVIFLLMPTRANLAAHIQKLYLETVCIQDVPAQSFTLLYIQGCTVVTRSDTWVSQALNTKARMADMACSTSLTPQPQYLPQGSQYIASANIDSFPSMNYMSLFNSKVEMVSHIQSLELLLKAQNCTLQRCTDFFGNVPSIIHVYTIGLTPGTAKKVSGYLGRYFHDKKEGEVTNGEPYFSIPLLPGGLIKVPHGREWRRILALEFRIKDFCS